MDIDVKFVDEIVVAPPVRNRCGADACPGDARPLPTVQCSDCQTTFHQKCLGYSDALFQRIQTTRWQCAACTVCWVCDQRAEQGMVLCDECDRGYHTFCLDPPLQAIPDGDWSCEHCAYARKNHQQAAAATQRPPTEPYAEVVLAPTWQLTADGIVDGAVEASLRLGNGLEEDILVCSALEANHSIRLLRLQVLTPTTTTRQGNVLTRVVAALKHMGSLTTLQLHDIDYRELSAAMFAEILDHNPSLVHLYFIGIQNGLMALLRKLFRSGHLRRIRTLALHDKAVTTTNLQPLISDLVRGSTALTQLHLSYPSAYMDVVHSFADALICNTTLQTLVLSDTKFNKGECKLLASALERNRTLEVLNILGGTVPSHSCEDLFVGLRKNRTLCGLTFNANGFREDFFRKLVGAIQSSPALVELGLSDNAAGDDGAAAIAALIPTCRNLSDLYLAHNRIKSLGATRLAAAVEQSSLRTLVLAENDIAPALGMLTNAIKHNRTLTFLNLAQTGLDMGSVPLLNEMLHQNTSLLTVDLSDNRLGLGAAALAPSLGHNRTLATLHLSRNGIESAAAVALAQAIAADSALTLYLGGNTITDDTRASVNNTLAQGAPKAKIMWIAAYGQPEQRGRTRSIDFSALKPRPRQARKRSADRDTPGSQAKRSAVSTAAGSAQQLQQPQLQTDSDYKEPTAHLVDLVDVIPLFDHVLEKRRIYQNLFTPLQSAHALLRQHRAANVALENAAQPLDMDAEQRLLPQIGTCDPALTSTLTELGTKALASLTEASNEFDTKAQTLQQNLFQLLEDSLCNELMKTTTGVKSTSESVDALFRQLDERARLVAATVSPASARVNFYASRLAVALKSEAETWATATDDIDWIEGRCRIQIAPQLVEEHKRLQQQLEQLRNRVAQLNEFRSKLPQEIDTLRELTRQRDTARAQCEQWRRELRMASERGDVAAMTKLEQRVNASQAHYRQLEGSIKTAQTVLMAPFVQIYDD